MISARAALSSTFNDIVQNRGLPSPHPVRPARDTHAQKYLGKFVMPILHVKGILVRSKYSTCTKLGHSIDSGRAHASGPRVSCTSTQYPHDPAYRTQRPCIIRYMPTGSISAAAQRSSAIIRRRRPLLACFLDDSSAVFFFDLTDLHRTLSKRHGNPPPRFSSQGGTFGGPERQLMRGNVVRGFRLFTSHFIKSINLCVIRAGSEVTRHRDAENRGYHTIAEFGDFSMLR